MLIHNNLGLNKKQPLHLLQQAKNNSLCTVQYHQTHKKLILHPKKSGNFPPKNRKYPLFAPMKTVTKLFMIFNTTFNFNNLSAQVKNWHVQCFTESKQSCDVSSLSPQLITIYKAAASR
jgi:hypothetical protein